MTIPAADSSFSVAGRAAWDSLVDSAINFTQSGSGAVSETVSAALQRMVHTEQYSSQANYETALAALSGTMGFSNLQIDYAAGTLQGVTQATLLEYTASGHADGTGILRALDVEPVISGSNDFTEATGIVSHVSYSASGTAQVVAAFSGSPRIAGSGTIQAATAFNGAVHLISGAGNIDTGMVYEAKAGTMTGSGTITNLIGFRCQEIGHAQITNAFGFQADDIISAATLNVGFRSALSPGSGKWNFYGDGTANNAFAGNVRIGSVVAPTHALNVTGSITASGDLSVDGSVVSGASFTAQAQILMANGTSTTPSIAFTNDPDTGFYWPAVVGRIHVTCNGGDAFRFIGDSNFAFDILHASGSVRIGSPVDVILARDAAATLALKNSTNAQELRIYGTEITAGSRYSRVVIKHAVTTLASVSGATVTATSLIPAKANVLGVNTIVTVALGTGSGTTGYAVGDGVDANRWGDVVGTAAGTDTDGNDATADPTGWFTAANNVVITAAGGNFDGTGSILVDVSYTLTEAA